MRCHYVLREWAGERLMSLGFEFADVPHLIDLSKIAATPADLTLEFVKLGMSFPFDESTLRLLAEEMFAKVRVECRCGCREEALDFGRRVAAAKLKERNYDEIEDEEEWLQNFYRDIDDLEEVDPEFLKALKISD